MIFADESVRDRLVIVCGESRGRAASAAEGGDVPRRRYTKQLIRVGEYHIDGRVLRVTPDTLRHWEATFSRMKTNGVKVPLPEGHTDAPGKNRGWVHGMWVEDDALVGEVEAVGADAINLAERSDVSICARRRFTDGKGNEYTWPILHVALTPTPVVPGLNGFVRVAASVGGGTLHEEDVPAAVPGRKEQTVPFDFKKCAKAVGIKKDVTEETFQAALAEHVTDLREQAEDHIELSKKLETTEAKVRTLETELRAAKEKNKEKDPDPQVLRLSRRTREQDLEALVSEGSITPPVRDALHAAWIGEDGGALKLSLGAPHDDLWDRTIEALKQNDPVELGEKAMSNAVEMSRRSPGSTEPTAEERKETRDRMRGFAGVKPKK
jgi:hypothetical protein